MSWRIIFATRALLPSMIERGSGYFLITSSAAGLLAALGSGPYSVTKAAAVKFAELYRDHARGRRYQSFSALPARC